MRRLLTVIAAMVVLVALVPTVHAQTPPYGCTASANPTTTSGATSTVSLACPTVSTGLRAQLFDLASPFPIGGDLIACPFAPELTTGRTVNLPALPGVSSFEWEVCNCSQTSCARTNRVTVTVQAPPPVGCRVTLNGTESSYQFPTSSGGNLSLAVLDCPPGTGGPTYTWLRDGLPASTAASWTDTPATNPKLGANTTSLPAVTIYLVDVCYGNGTTCTYFPAIPYTAAVLPATAAAPTGCQVSLAGSTGNYQFPTSSGGLLPLAVSSCTPSSGLTYSWRRDGIAGVSNLASWTDTPGLNPKLGPNNGPSPVSTGYQVQVCNGSACATFPGFDYVATVPGNVVSTPVCTPSASNDNPLVGTSIVVSANCSGNPTSYTWSGCNSSSATCSDSSSVAGPKTYTVTASNSVGSSTPASKIVTWGTGTVPVCQLSPSPSSTLPPGQTVTLTATCTNNPTSYTWGGGCVPVPGTNRCTDTLASEGSKQYTVAGRNASGLGPGSTPLTVSWTIQTPQPPTGSGTVTGASSGAADSGFSSLIRDDGTLWSWGTRTLGDGTTTSRSVPGAVGGLEGIKATASALHTLALTQGGQVFAWGPNPYGELGIGNTTTQSSPVLVPGLSNVVAIAVGDNFSLALQGDGSVWAWGRNHVGQLGDGTTVDRLSPVRVTGIADVKSIAASFSHAAVSLGNGTVFVWGDNLYVPQNQSSRPVQVPITNVALVQAGGLNTFALKNDGSVWGWGRPDGGRLGDGGAGNGRTPVQVSTLSGITSITVGEAVSLAVNSSGQVFGWGENSKGQLGRGNANAVSTPVPLSIPTTGTIAKAAAGDSNFVVDSRGKLFGAGANELGALGLGDTLETRAPKIVAGIAGVVAVAAGATESIALRDDGTVWSWGGRDPADASAGNPKPAQVAGLTGRFVAIAAGSTNVVAVRDDGVVFGWGKAVPGAPGPLTTTPIAISGLTDIASAATGAAGIIGLTRAGRAVIACAEGCPGTDFQFADVTAVAAGERHFLVRRADGSVWAWGANDKGQLGNGGTAVPSAPVRVGNLTNVAKIAAGMDFSVAIQADGTAYAWGRPPPFNDTKIAPVRVVELDGTDKLSAATHVLALVGIPQHLGRAWGGRSRVGERDRAVPGSEPRMDGLQDIAAGYNHSLGITAAGEVVAWGLNTYLQLGVARKQASFDWVEVVDPANPLYTKNALPVVEFLNPTIEFGHFFITIDPPEIKNLDNGGIPNWQRTGRSWRAWLKAENAPVPVKPVYRFFSSRWNSHFYTVDEAEKNGLIAKNPERDLNKDWVLESTAFYAVPGATTCPSLSVLPRAIGLCSGGQQPAARDCPADYYPIYRAFNVQEDKPNPKRTLPNHRFTSNWVDIYRLVRFFGYTYEGVAFCAPASTQRGGDLQAFNTYPGDTVGPGEFVQFDYWFGNAGPGTAHEATLVAVIPPIDNMLVLCQEYNGAKCPPQSQWNEAALRKGVPAPQMPAGGVLRFTVNGQAPAEPQALSFTSSIGSPSESPDGFGLNNASPVSRTNVKSATACTVTTTPDSIAFAAGGGTSELGIGLPPNCTWVASIDPPSWATLDVPGGNGAGSPKLAAARNDAEGERQAIMTITSGTSSAKIAIRQSGNPPAAPCTSVKFSRAGDNHDSNERPSASVTVETPNDCAWSPAVDVTWIALKAVTGRGSGPLEYALQANDGEERVGNITIGNRAYYVGQSARRTSSTDAPSGGGGGDGGGDGSGGDGSGGDAGG